jgi:hypothetical protein
LRPFNDSTVMKSPLLRYLLCLLLFLPLPLRAQQRYAVQSSLTLAPPYSLYFSDYAAPGSDQLSLMLLLQAEDKFELPVRLRLRIEGAGLTIQTRPDYLPSPIYLQNGLPEYFSGADLSEYLEPTNLLFSGSYSRSDYMRSGRLPEGVYRICVEVVETLRGQTVALASCQTAWLMLGEPPLLNLPENHSVPVATEPQQLLFQWTPLHTASPNSAFSTQYHFRLYELWPEDRDPEELVRSSQPFFETTTQATSLAYGMAEPPLEPGRKYVWRVQATDSEGKDLFENEGYSEAFTFQWGEICLPAEQLTAKALNHEQFQVRWQASEGQTQFKIQYRKAGTAEWYEQNTYLSELTISGLAPGTSYEYRLQGLCSSQQASWSETGSLTLPEPEESDFACGASPMGFSLEDSLLVAKLSPGEVVMAGDFDVKLVKVRRTGERFSGTGLVVLPMMNHLKVAVEFEGIKVNRALRMIEGRMRVTGATVQVLDDETMAQINHVIEEVNGVFETVSNILDKADQIIETVNNITGQGGDDSWIDESEYADMTAEELAQAGVALIYEAKETLATDLTSPEALETLRQGAQLVKRAIAMGADVNSAIRNSLKEATEVIDAFMVEFVAYENPSYGFDRQRQQTITHKYEQTIVGEESRPVPWKSVAAGEQDKVLVQMLPKADSISLEDIRFTSDFGQLVPQKNNQQQSLLLTGRAHEQVEAIYATYEPKESETDTTDEEAAPEPLRVGKLNVISYKLEKKKVVLVPLSGIGYQPDKQSIQNSLNAIYKQAVVEWEVVVREPLSADWDTDADGKLDEGPSGMFTNYTEEMKMIIQAQQQQRGIEEETFYLFLVPRAKTDAGKMGFMPRKRQMGFLFAPAYASGEKQLVRTIAHELGHGAFNLEHTFKDFPAMPQGTTDNLMDYNTTGTTLYKYQWDYIHDPVAVVGWAQDEGDAESINFCDVFVQDNLNQIRQANISEDEFVTIRWNEDMDCLFEGGFFTETSEGTSHLSLNHLHLTAPLSSYGDEITFKPSEFKKDTVDVVNETTGAVEAEYYRYSFGQYLDEENPYIMLSLSVLPNESKDLEDYLNLTYSARINAVFESNETLNSNEIKDIRELIATIQDEEERKQMYRELQTKVEYHDQRNNEHSDIADKMCNLTSEAMCLEYLGVSCPDPDKQFEDYLEDLRIENGYGSRTSHNGRAQLANHLGVEVKYLELGKQLSEEKWKEKLLPSLEDGKSILLSVFKANYGHIVRLQDITDDGFLIDDPYGKLKDFQKRNSSFVGYREEDSYDCRNGCEDTDTVDCPVLDENTCPNLGENNLWKWGDLNKIKIKYAEIYSIN